MLDGTYQWNFVQVGTNTVSDIVNAIKTGHTYFNVHTSTNTSGEILGFFNLASAGQSVPIPTPPPPLAGGTPTAEDASRFVNQCTCGATKPVIEQVQQQGFNAFLECAIQPAAELDARVCRRQNHPAQPRRDRRPPWPTKAISAPDQLRQRVAFALSEILVTSLKHNAISERPIAMAVDHDICSRTPSAIIAS